jgi:hypothetical protein
MPLSISPRWVSYSSSALLFLVLGLFFESFAKAQITLPVGHRSQIRYINQTLAFEAGREAAFVAHGRGYSLSLKAFGDASLTFGPKAGRHPSPDPSSTKAIEKVDSEAAWGHKVDIRLGGMRLQSRLTGEDVLAGRVNYLLGNEPAKWKTGVPTYAKVRYSGVYPGIDLVYYGSQDQLEFDFDVAASANPRQIEMQFGGARRLTLDRKGDLSISVGDDSITLRKPVIYQEQNGQRQPVTGSFRLLGRHTVGFHLGRYDHTRPLVIDPILTYSTYLGLNGSGSANAVAVDAAGNAYVTGTYTPGFPTTDGAFQTGDNGKAIGAPNAFVTKFDPNGNVVYSTYIGGSIQDGGNAIAVDAAGNAYIAGYTSSPDFPVTSGAYQTTDKVTEQPNFRQFTTFVAKLNPTGTALVYSTFLGGSVSDNPEPQTEGQEQATSIGVDSAGNAWVAGFTFSTDFPTTSNAVQTANPAAADQDFANFLTKLNSTGTALDYSTYLGEGSSPPAVAVDSAGSAYITGDSLGTNFPTTPGAFLSSGPGVGAGSFITKFSSSGGAPVYSTLVGSATSSAWLKAIAVDSAGNAYVGGDSHADNFPTTPGVIQPTLPGGVVVKMNPTGTAMVYSTFLGFGPDTLVNGIAVDSAGDAYVAGMMGAGTFPLTPDALQNQVYSFPNGVDGSFVAKLNPTATAVDYGTYLSGYGTNSENAYDCDCANGIAVDPSGNAVVVGQAASVDFPTTIGAFEVSPFNFPYNDGAIYFLPFVTKFTGSEMTSLPLTNMNLSVNANPQYRESNVVFTAKLTPASGNGIPTGSVEFSTDFGPLCNVPVDSTGTATCTTELLTVGDNPVRVSYYGDQSDSAVTQTMTETIVGIPTTTTISGSHSTAVYGSPLTFTAYVKANTGSGIPTGVVSFNIACTNGIDGNPFIALDNTGHATCDVASNLAIGNYSVNVMYTGDTNYAQSTSPNLPLTIQPIGVAPTPTFTPAAGTFTQTLQVALADTNAGAAIFYTTDGSTPSATNGQVYSVPIAVGSTEMIQAIAVVQGYTNSGIASATYTLPPNFTLSLSTQYMTLSGGQTMTSTVSLTSQFAFNGVVTFSCSGLPAGTSCSFSPATLTGNPLDPVTTTLTVSGGATAAVQPESSKWWPLTSLAVVFGAFGLRKRRRLGLLVLTFGISVALIGMTACSGGGGGGGAGGGGQNPITSTVTVTGTSGTLQNTATLSVTYTP